MPILPDRLLELQEIRWSICKLFRSCTTLKVHRRMRISIMAVTEKLAAWAAETPDIKAAGALDKARDAVLDTIGVMIAGASDQAAKRVRRAVALWGNGPSTVVGQSETLAPPWAALANGTAAHVLDFDDSFSPVSGHSSAVMVPAPPGARRSGRRFRACDPRRLCRWVGNSGTGRSIGQCGALQTWLALDFDSRHDRFSSRLRAAPGIAGGWHA